VSRKLGAVHIIPAVAEPGPEKAAPMPLRLVTAGEVLRALSVREAARRIRRSV